MELGHLSPMTLQEAWQSRKAKDNVRGFITGKHLDLCRNCSWYAPVTQWDVPSD
jgi:hypothetical protein